MPKSGSRSPTTQTEGMKRTGMRVSAPVRAASRQIRPAATLYVGEVHNLTYLHELMTHARAAIGAGAFGAYSDAVRGGAAPWTALDLS